MRDFRALNLKWDAFIKSLPSRFSDLGEEKTERLWEPEVTPKKHCLPDTTVLLHV